MAKRKNVQKPEKKNINLKKQKTPKRLYKGKMIEKKSGFQWLRVKGGFIRFGGHGPIARRRQQHGVLADGKKAREKVS